MTDRTLDDTWVVIMAGGSGKRFWPWSRRRRPKQCLPVVGDTSLLRRTLERSSTLAPAERTVIVTAASNADAVRQELGGDERVLIEPEGRNTAACVAWAAHEVSRTAGERACVAVLPADHHIGDDEAFAADCDAAISLAREGWLVTLGIAPTRPESGYGWIRTGTALEVDRAQAWRVAEFTEKPTRAIAERWLAEGGRLWNSGMFFFRCDRILEEVARWLPAHGALFGAAADIPAGYPNLPAISIDHGVMEKATEVAVVSATFAWSDVGSWGSLSGIGASCEATDSVVRGDVLELDGRGNVLIGEGGLVAVLGVEGLVVVHSGDAVLVCPVERAQEVRRLIDQLEEAGRDDVL